MKKIILLLSLIIITACGCKKKTQNKEKKYERNISKQTLADFNGDTLAYIQTKIIDRKDYYIGKKFGLVLEDFDIPIKSFLYSADANNIAKVSSSAFLIYDSYLQVKNKLNKGEIPIVLVVRWNPSLKAEDIDKLNSKKGKHGEWNSENEAYFREQIVGDLSRTNYPVKK